MNERERSLGFNQSDLLALNTMIDEEQRYIDLEQELQFDDPYYIKMKNIRLEQHKDRLDMLWKIRNYIDYKE